jgi:hypothetical protein
LKLKAAAHAGDPKLLAEAMRSYPGAEDLNTRNCSLEGFELFGSTKRKLDNHLDLSMILIVLTK